MQAHDIAPIDLVVVNLYPFEEVRRSGGDYASIVENIDIGGPAMTRAAAVIQPGGSMRDDEVIAAADAHGIAMVFTGVRHFRH